MLSAQGRGPSTSGERAGWLAVTIAKQIFSLAQNPVKRILRQIGGSLNLTAVRLGYPEKSCPGYCAAGLPSTTEIATKRWHRRSVPRADIAHFLGCRRRCPNLRKVQSSWSRALFIA